MSNKPNTFPIGYGTWIIEVVEAIQEVYAINALFLTSRSNIGDFAYDFGKPSPEELNEIEAMLGIKLAPPYNICEIAVELIRQDTGMVIHLGEGSDNE
jgi:hypothetical protein